MKKFLPLLLLLSACADDHFTDKIELHVRNESSASTFWVATTSSTDSTSFPLTEYEQDFIWSPKMKGDGAFVIGANDLTDTVGYFTSGAVHDSGAELWISISDSTLSIGYTEFEEK